MLGVLLTLLKGALTVAPVFEAAVRSRRSRDNEAPERDIEVEREVLQQIWQAFLFQSRQRSLLLGCALVTLALGGVGFTVALAADLPVLAAVNALAGMVLVVFFNRLDAAYRARLRVSERAFRNQDERLVAAGDPSRMGLIAPAAGISLEVLLLAVEAGAFWGFVAAGVYAIVEVV
jgi:hypothetical protein